MIDIIKNLEDMALKSPEDSKDDEEDLFGADTGADSPNVIDINQSARGGLSRRKAMTNATRKIKQDAAKNKRKKLISSEQKHVVRSLENLKNEEALGFDDARIKGFIDTEKLPQALGENFEPGVLHIHNPASRD